MSGIYNVLTAMGSALPTFGGSAGQSLAGVLGTASHGGDLDRKPLADWVHGLLLVGEGGRVSWIERETGGPYIDEPKLRAASYSASDIDIFRDDDMLNAAVAACGRMGVIYAMLLELVGTYNLHESRTWLPWPMVRDTASRGFPSLVNMMQYDNRQLHFLQILLSLDRDFPTCSVTRRNETRDNNWIPRPADPDLSWDLLFHHSDWIGILGGPQSELGSRLNGVSDADIRAIMAYVYANFLAPRQVQGPYWYVMDAGAGELRVQASEYAFDANDTTYLNFIDDVLLLARSPQIPGLLALRYCPRSDALLAVSKYETTVHVEIAVPRGYNGNASFYERVQEQALARRGIPHLGQHNELNANQMRAAFGNDLHTWRKALTRTCERAQRGTFSNSFSRERGLEPLGHDNLLLFG